MKLAFAEEGVAIPLAQTIDRAECGGTQSSTHALHFLSTQVTSASANQHSVLVIHIFLLWLLGPFERVQALQKKSSPSYRGQH